MGCHGEENAHLCRAVELLNAVLSEVRMLGLSPVLQKRETGGEASWLASSYIGRPTSP